MLLLFVNAAARLATVPVTTVPIPDPVTGGVVAQRFVDLAEARAQEDTLDRLRFFSILGFAGLCVGGVAVGNVVAGRALRPVSQMAEVARRISGSNLKERITPSGPDDELRELGVAFDDMVARLDDAFDRQRQFVADASHELRTPLTALQLVIDDVRSDPDAGIDDYRRVADEAAGATARMRRLVDDLLALAETGAPRPAAPVDLASLAEAVVEEVEPLAARRGVGISAGVPPGTVVFGDADSLRRALRNLVENGVRYNHPGGHVRVDASPAPAGWAAVTVADDGIGIPQDAQDRIFDRFYRVDAGRSTAEGGSGLGLSIVRKIVGEHGGAVTVDSRPGDGSRFTVMLPAAANATPR